MHCAQVVALFNVTAQNFPDAEIRVSTLDAYFELLIAEAPKLNLPVVTGEIGDTWIYGERPSVPPCAYFAASALQEVISVGPWWHHCQYRTSL